MNDPDSFLDRRADADDAPDGAGPRELDWFPSQTPNWLRDYYGGDQSHEMGEWQRVESTHGGNYFYESKCTLCDETILTFNPGDNALHGIGGGGSSATFKNRCYGAIDRELAALREQLAARDAELGRAKLILTALQWSGASDLGTLHAACPVCGAYRGRGTHYPDCELPAIIGGPHD